jgi:hypothetical protein
MGEIGQELSSISMISDEEDDVTTEEIIGIDVLFLDGVLDFDGV